MRTDCPFCGSIDFKLYRANQLTRIGSRRSFYTCQSCGTIYPRPRFYLQELENNLSKYKPDPEPLSSILKSDLEYLKFISDHIVLKKIKTSLDIGASEGRMLFLLKKKKIEAFGIEPEKSALDVARSYNLNVYPGNFPDIIPPEISQRKYDLILMNEVIYYFENIKTALKRAQDFLSENGTLIIKAHHGGSPYYASGISLFTRYGDQVQSVPTDVTLKIFLEKTGYTQIKILPYPEKISFCPNDRLVAIAKFDQ